MAIGFRAGDAGDTSVLSHAVVTDSGGTTTAGGQSFLRSAVLVFMLCFGTHAFLVDTGRLDSPYLSTYGFLALVGLTSYDLAGEVMRTSVLSSKLAQRESDLRTAVADERNRIAGELHDSVTQTLFSTAAIADALPEVWRRRPEEAMRGLEDLKHLTKGCAGRDADAVAGTPSGNFGGKRSRQSASAVGRLHHRPNANPH